MNNYVLKGRILKQVGLNIIPNLSGVLFGLAAEVLSDTNVIVYQLDRTKRAKAVLFLHWKPGSVTDSYLQTLIEAAKQASGTHHPQRALHRRF